MRLKLAGYYINCVVTGVVAGYFILDNPIVGVVGIAVNILGHLVFWKYGGV